MSKQKITGRELWDLFLCTFKIGAITFGGGYVIVPMLEQEFCEKRKYITKEDILDIVAISQSLPGVIAVNACIMIGYRRGGVLTALVTMLGVVLPSFIILSIVTYFYEAFAHNEYVAAAFNAISAAVVALMFNAVLRLGKSVLTKPLPCIILLVVFVLAFHFGINAITLIIASGVIGFVFSFTPIGRGRGEEGDDA